MGPSDGGHPHLVSVQDKELRERGHQRLHTVLGHWPRFLRSHSQLLPQRIRLQRPQVRHQGGQTEELRARLHDRGEVCWGTRLPHCWDMAGMVEEQRIDPKMIFSYVQEVYRMCNEL